MTAASWLPSQVLGRLTSMPWRLIPFRARDRGRRRKSKACWRRWGKASMQSLQWHLYPSPCLSVCLPCYQIPADLITLDPDQVSKVDPVQPKEEGEEVSALAIMCLVYKTSQLVWCKFTVFKLSMICKYSSQLCDAVVPRLLGCRK